MSTSLLTDTSLTVGGQMFHKAEETVITTANMPSAITASMMTKGFIKRSMDNVTVYSRMDDEVATAASIVAAIPEVSVGSSFVFDVQVTTTNGNAKPWRLIAHSTRSAGTTLVGNMSCVAGEGITFFVRVTNATSGSEAVTVYSSSVSKVDPFEFSKEITVNGVVASAMPSLTMSGSSNLDDEEQIGILSKDSGSFALVYFAGGTDVVGGIDNPKVNSSWEWYIRNTTATEGGYLQVQVLGGNPRDSLVCYTGSSLNIYNDQMRRIRTVITNVTPGSEAVTYYDMGTVKDESIARQNLYIKDRVFETTTVSNSTSSGVTYNYSQLEGGIIRRTLGTSSTTDSFPSAASVVTALAKAAFAGNSIVFYVINRYNNTTRTVTIQAGTGNNIQTEAQTGGNIVIANGEGRMVMLQVNNLTSGSEACTYYDLGKIVYN